MEGATIFIALLLLFIFMICTFIKGRQKNKELLLFEKNQSISSWIEEQEPYPKISISPPEPKRQIALRKEIKEVKNEMPLKINNTTNLLENPFYKIKELKKLLDIGAITLEEFNDKKKELLKMI